MYLTLLHSERSKLHRVLAVLSAIGLRKEFCVYLYIFWFHHRYVSEAYENQLSEAIGMISHNIDFLIE